MKDMLLTYADNAGWDSLSEDEQTAIHRQYMALTEDRAVRNDNRFHPATEELGGYYLVDAHDLDGAIAVAARIPAARSGGAVEVRPVMER